jgi:hypothetical protein
VDRFRARTALCQAAPLFHDARITELQHLRGSQIGVVYSLRQHGTSYFLFFVFALAERKNEKQ